MNLILSIVLVLCALGLVAMLINKRNLQAQDSVAAFRRQLGALSPDAHRRTFHGVEPDRTPNSAPNDVPQDRVNDSTRSSDGA